MNVLSLFDGMSCGRIALERAGIKVDNYYASEIEKSAIKISKHNWPDIVQLGDVTKIKILDETFLPQVYINSENGDYLSDGIHLLIAGSPCQGFSSAGKQLNFEDPRSKLFFEFLRIKNECKPTWFLLENVKMGKKEQDIISEYLGVEPVLINSNLLSAQNRERLYWTNVPFDMPEDKGIILNDIIDGEQSCSLASTIGDIQNEVNKHTSRCVGITVHKNGNIRPYQKGKAGIGELTVVCNTNNKSNTFVKTHVPKIYTQNPFAIRKLSHVEAERLQTVPDGYTNCVSYRQATSALGNGWTVDIIAHILKGIECGILC